MKGVRSGVERRRGVCVGIEREGPWAERNTLRERKSLRIGVHRADAVVWGPVYGTSSATDRSTRFDLDLFRAREEKTRRARRRLTTRVDGSIARAGAPSRAGSRDVRWRTHHVVSDVKVFHDPRAFETTARAIVPRGGDSTRRAL